VRELFVWYRVAPAREQEASAFVLEMQRALVREIPGLATRLLVRSEPSLDRQTWMETYAHPGGIDAAAEAAIERRARELSALIDGERHAEAFLPAA